MWSSLSIAQAPPPGAEWPTDPELQAALRELAAVLAANPGDARRDDLRTILDRRKAIAAGIESFQHRVLKGLIDPLVIATDITRFAHDTAPRLLGNVVRVGPQGDAATLAEALDMLQPGDLVLLGEGTHELKVPRQRLLADVAFVGAGKTTVLTGELEQASRVRFENLAIDCRDRPFLNLYAGGAVHLRRCFVANYNSGAGGSNAIYGVEVAMLIEDCEFEGKSGRAKDSSHGDALDLRGEFVVALRRTRFIDNDEVVRATGLTVVDQCTAEGHRGHGVLPYAAGQTFARSCDLPFHSPPIELPCASDDLDFVRCALGVAKNTPPAIAAAVAASDATHNLRYWIALRRHPDPGIGALAAQGLARLLAGSPPQVPAFTEECKRVPEAMREAFAGELAATWLERWRTGGAGKDLEWDAGAGRYRRRP
ncbi:MAG: hypothetical protein IPK26_22055 [Planctomycetes bacterium]|nr:hypothetical protein [Planctomycetota bacterium]